MNPISIEQILIAMAFLSLVFFLLHLVNDLTLFMQSAAYAFSVFPLLHRNIYAKELQLEYPLDPFWVSPTVFVGVLRIPGLRPQIQKSREIQRRYYRCRADVYLVTS